ncbi:MAG: DUF58 domain-containing protein [Armatimonadetes bacterium]|nr:DUF58 domain-containing protein [Armatimonadota bacterium]
MTSTHLLEPDFLRRLETLTLLSRRMARSGVRGERRSPTLGRGVEFADYRSYQAGDDYRYIDWHIYSRLDRLFVKLFSEEEDINVHLLVDRSASMALAPAAEISAASSSGSILAGLPAMSKLDYAVRVAAAIGYIGLVSLDRVGAAGFDRRVTGALGPGRGRGQTLHLFRFLSGLTPGDRSDLSAAMREYVHTTRRRGLLVLLSDLLMPGGVADGLKLARAHHFDLFVIHILSEEDLAPPFAGDLRLIDSESGAGMEVTVDGPALRAYLRARDRYLADLEQFCLRHRIEYLRTTTAVPFPDLILRYLRVGGLIA